MKLIVSIGDNIDFPNNGDWLKIQFRFLITEMSVTDTSKKAKSVIKAPAVGRQMAVRGALRLYTE